MNRASPETVNQSMRAVQILLDAGIDFVPVPVRDVAHKKELLLQGSVVLEVLVLQAEEEERNDECK